MLSTSGQAQIPRLALLTGFKVVHAMFQPQMQVGYGPWHCFGPPSGLLILSRTTGYRALSGP